MNKKMYVNPQTEVMNVNTRLMQGTGEQSVLPGPGLPERRDPKLF